LPAERLHIVAPSTWIAGQARRSSLFGRFPLTMIANGLDLNDFAPRNRAAARVGLGLAAAAPVVLFVGTRHNPRKGFARLVHALAPLADRVPGLLLLTVGSGAPLAPVPLPHVHLKPIDNDRFLSLVYSAADVFVMPSMEESFGQTVTESIACGTPVVAFAAGGMLDTVRPGVTGMLVPVGEVVPLRSAVSDMLDDTAGEAGRMRWAERCRAVAVEEYSLELQAERFLDVYRRLARPALAAASHPAREGATVALTGAREARGKEAADGQ
jgi:glycosyltransferase involved in cell wall biosynthesis